MACFTNHYVETSETHKELRWRTLNWPMLIGLSSCIIAMLCALCAGGVYGLMEDNTLLVVYCFVMAAAFVIACYQIPYTIVRHVKLPKKFGEINTRFTNDCIELIVNGGCKEKPYSEIVKLSETKNFFILIFENEKNGRSFLPVKKSDLNGASAEFEDFINKKISANRKKGR